MRSAIAEPPNRPRPGDRADRPRRIVPGVLLRTRLAALLSVSSLNMVTETHLQALVANSAAEDQDLDFKQTRYNYGPDGTFELAKDIAALANHVGGLLVIGMAEDDQGRASGLTPVKLDDSEKGRIRQVIADRVFPMVANVQVRGVPTAAHPARGYYLILVPRSTLVPHAVRRTDPQPLWLCYPLRHGTTTHYQTETEIAARYRDRFAAARSQIQRLEQIQEDGRHGETPDLLAIAVGLVPAVPGERPLIGPGPTVGDFINGWETQYWPLKGQMLSRRTIARRRLRGQSSTAIVELHTDGAGWARIVFGDHTATGDLMVSLQDLEYYLIELLAFLGAYSAWTGAAGDCAISTCLYGALTAKSIGVRTHQTSEVTALTEPPSEPAETTALLDQLAGSREQVGQAAYPLARDIEQDMGFAAPVLLQPDGVLRDHR